MPVKVLILFFTILISAAGFSSAQNVAAPEKVKSVTEAVIETRGGKENEKKKSFQAFDQRGNLIEEIDYEDDGKIKVRNTYEYNNQDQKVKETNFLPDGKIEEVAVYTYDQFGNRTSKTVMNRDGVVKSKKVFHYDYR